MAAIKEQNLGSAYKIDKPRWISEDMVLCVVLLSPYQIILLNP